MAELKRTLGVWGAANVSIGAIIGTGIFVLIGVAAGATGPAVILSFVIAGITVLFTALSAAEMASFIHESGGSYAFASRAFGRFAGYVVGWMQSFDYIVGASAVAIGFAAYFTYLVGLPQSTSNLMTIGAILPLGLTLLNLVGLREASGANNVLVTLKVLALVLFIAVGGYVLISTGDTSHYTPFMPSGWSGVFHGAALIFFAYVGVNTVTTLAEEVKDPARTLPRAILIAMLVTNILYLGVSIVAVGLVNYRVLGTSSAPLETALIQATSNVFVLKFVAISALFATTSVVLSSIFGGSRMIFAMARHGLLPEPFSHISGRGIPFLAVILAGIIMSVIVVVANANLAWLASIFNFGTLLTYFFINASVLQLRRAEPGQVRPFRVPLYPAIPLAGLVSCGFLAFFLSRNAWIAGAAWIAIGVVVYRLRRGGPLLEGVPGE